MSELPRGFFDRIAVAEPGHLGSDEWLIALGDGERVLIVADQAMADRAREMCRCHAPDAPGDQGASS